MSEQAPSRFIALDLFRGYTVIGMLIVNFVGSYPAMPKNLGHHHTFCSYADTIMPQFLFAVGMAMRMVYLKSANHFKFVKRSFGLILLGCVVYHLTGEFKSWSQIQNADWPTFFAHLFKRGPFETLTHIGATTLFVLPVIAGSTSWRLVYLIASAVLHVAISHLWYFDWNLSEPKGIDGGPLAFLSWAIPLLMGTIITDWVQNVKPHKIAYLGIVIMLLTVVAMAILNPTAIYPFAIRTPQSDNPVFNYWTMSQRTGSIMYTIFGTGVSLLMYGTFQAFEHFLNWPIFNLFGQHALAAYLIHDLVAGAVKPFVPKDAPGWYVWCGFGIYFGITWLFVRYLERHKLYLKL